MNLLRAGGPTGPKGEVREEGPSEGAPAAASLDSGPAASGPSEGAPAAASLDSGPAASIVELRQQALAGRRNIW